MSLQLLEYAVLILIVYNICPKIGNIEILSYILLKKYVTFSEKVLEKHILGGYNIFKL